MISFESLEAEVVRWVEPRAPLGLALEGSKTWRETMDSDLPS